MNEFPAAGWAAIGVLATALVAFAGHLLTRRSKSADQDFAVMQASLARVDSDLQRLQSEVKELRTELHGIRRLFRLATDHARGLIKQLRAAGIEPEPAPDELADSI